VIPPDDAGPWIDGSYASDDDPAGAARARLIWLELQRRIAEGWRHPPARANGRPAASGWIPPARNLDGQDALAALELRAWLEMTAAAAP
jgi:hypothetical protein